MSQKKNKNSSLKEAANEWKPDRPAKEEVEKPSRGSASTFVNDPLQSSYEDIKEAQNLSDALDLDGDLEDDYETLDFTKALEESEEQLDRLQSSLKGVDQETQKELEAALKEEQDDLEAENQRQIEEDIALEKEAKAQEQEEAPAFEGEPKEEADELDFVELESSLEAVLFIADRPLSLNRLREIVSLGFVGRVYKQALKHLQDRYAETHHGLELVEVGGGYQFRTKPGKSEILRKLAKVQTHKLSRGAMETLAIVAYKQPVMKEEIDQIRGVDSSHFIRTLLDKSLIEMSGRSELPGRPILYTTSATFMEVFGVKDMESLPPLQELEKMIPSIEVQGEEDDPKIRQMKALVQQMNQDQHRIQYNPKEDEEFLSEIRERVKSIAITTDTLEAQDQEDEQPSETEEVFLEDLLAQAEKTSPKEVPPQS